jgi:hypothetical protein
MIYKKGVIIYQCWQFEHVKHVCDKVWRKVFGHESLLTSGMDGDHSDLSLHYQGLGWDLRTRHSNSQTGKFHSKRVLNAVAKQLRLLLGADYDVVVEATHIHIEFDPKPIHWSA